MRLNGSGVNPPRMGYFLERSRLVRNEIESLLFGVFLQLIEARAGGRRFSGLQIYFFKCQTGFQLVTDIA